MTRGSWLVAGAIGLALAAGPVQAQETLRIGFVTFLSGPAAGPFGVPARNAAELMVEALNAGQVPAPYDRPGIAGAKIEMTVIDEAGGAQAQVAEYRKLAEQVDVVIGYISSGDCKAIAPVAEEMQRLTVFFDCGTPQIFEEVVTEPKYLFRTSTHSTIESIAAARYILDLIPGLKTIAGLNQNYAWGQDSWRDFSRSILALRPDVQVVAELFPQLFAGQYGSEISALLAAGADVVHSSFWGGDLEAFILQAAPRGLFQTSRVILPSGETTVWRLAGQLPDGTVIGARGPNGPFAPDNELNRWFRSAYHERYGEWPVYSAYHMARAILGTKAAFEKAAGNGGGLPSTDAVIAAFENLVFDSPSGEIRMALGRGHQAVAPIPYGVYRYDAASGQPTFEDVRYYAPECVAPPPDMKGIDWIGAGFPGAKC
ncbi:hypothetical protein HRbin39_00274 [bacterium HR39]|nr:hypothetical protein HRbin39_00274 [bacterium HR39]